MHACMHACTHARTHAHTHARTHSHGSARARSAAVPAPEHGPCSGAGAVEHRAPCFACRVPARGLRQRRPASPGPARYSVRCRDACARPRACVHAPAAPSHPVGRLLPPVLGPQAPSNRTRTSSWYHLMCSKTPASAPKITTVFGAKSINSRISAPADGRTVQRRRCRRVVTRRNPTMTAIIV